MPGSASPGNLEPSWFGVVVLRFTGKHEVDAVHYGFGRALVTRRPQLGLPLGPPSVQDLAEWSWTDVKLREFWEEDHLARGFH